MEIIEPGHVYRLNWIDSPPALYNPACGDSLINNSPTGKENDLIFVSREPHPRHGGAQNQEVIRALIDRVKYLNEEIKWEGNDQIIYHLRMALVLHESRALLRKTEKGYILPECISISNKDGHFRLSNE